MKTKLLILLFLASLSSYAQYTTIPDVNFENKLIVLGIDSGVSDGKVLTSSISSLISLNVSSSSITNLTGIEDFVALESLMCENNQLTTLDITKNIALTLLYCSQNQIANLDVSKNTNLLDLQTGNNPLRQLDISTNLALTHLECYKNQLSVLDVSQNVALNYLDCFKNQLTSLDLSKNVELEVLYCYDNQLTSLDVSNNTALTGLSCSQNQLSSLDISQNLSLEGMDCYFNKLTNLDVSKNTSLTFLSCYNNQITNLDITKNTALTYFKCNNNSLVNLNLKNGKNTLLKSSSLNLTGNPNLNCIQVDDAIYSNANWSSIKNDTANFNTDCATSNLYTYIPDVNFENKLISLGIDSGVADGKVLTTNVDSLTTLDVSNSNISNLAGIEDFALLTNLYCNQNQLTALNINKNTFLKTLDCNNNKIETLDVSNNVALDSLSCYTNRLTALDVKTNKTLKKLDCGSNQISSLDLSTNTALAFLGCNTSLLTTLDLSKNTALNLLDCRENKLTYLDVSKMTTLTELYCQSNQLTNLDISKNKALEFLNCSKNQLTTLDVSVNTALVGLYSNSNQLKNLNLKNGNNVKIGYLNLINNPNLSCIQVDDIDYFNTNWSSKKDAAANFNTDCPDSNPYTLIPDSNFEQKLIDLGIDTDGLNGKITIADISTITTLDLSNSNIKDLTGIENFTALNILDCSNNQLTALDLSKNTNLQILYVTGNPLVYINLKNGNNQNLIVESQTSKNTANTQGTSFLGLTSLGCVKVDSVAYSNTNWSKIKESTTIYSETCTLGIEDSVFDKVAIYPNPTQGELHIDNIILEKATVYNALGKLVKTTTFTSGANDNMMHFEGFPSGVYYIYLESEGANTAKKIMVE